MDMTRRLLIRRGFTAFGYSVIISNIPEEAFAFDLGGVLGTVSNVSGTASTLLQGIGGLTGQPEASLIGQGLGVLSGVTGMASGGGGMPGGQSGGAAFEGNAPYQSGGGSLPGGMDMNALIQYLQQALGSQTPPGTSPDAAPIMSNPSPAPVSQPYSYQSTDTPMDLPPQQQQDLQQNPYNWAANNADRFHYHLDRNGGPTVYHQLQLPPRSVSGHALYPRPGGVFRGPPNSVLPHRMAPVAYPRGGGQPRVASAGGRFMPGAHRR